MKTKILLILLVISVAFNLGVLFKVTAKSPLHGQVDGDDCNWKDCSMSLDLCLTTQQIQELEKHRRQFQEESAPLRAQLEEERLRLFQLLKKDTLDETEAHRYVQTISGLQSRIQDKFIRHFFRIKTIFDSEQQGKFYYYFQQGLCSGKHTSCSARTYKKQPGYKEARGAEGRSKSSDAPDK